MPNAALSSGRATTKLALVVDDHGRAEAVAVGVGVANADLTEVMGPGVAAGRVVVTDASPVDLPGHAAAPLDLRRRTLSGTCCGPSTGGAQLLRERRDVRAAFRGHERCCVTAA